MNKVYCDLCRVYVHKNSLWKHNESDKDINNQRYEQEDNYDDIVEIPENLYKEKQFRGFVNPFHLKKPLGNQHNVIIIHYNLIDLNSELKVVGKFIQNISQYHINNIVKEMAIKNGELIKQFKFLIKVYANVRYEKYPEDEPTEVINHHIPVNIITNLRRILLNDLDFTSDLDNEMQRREIQGSGWNLQGMNYLKI